MAERSNATAKKTQDGGLDVSTLQKRGRRRLVGAIALVLLAVIVLPMVFDPEPKPNTPLVNIRIPGEDGSKFTPKVATPAAAGSQAMKPATPSAAATAVPPVQAPAPVAEPARPATRVEEAEKPAKPAEKPAAMVAEKPVSKMAEKPAAKATEKPASKAPEKIAAPATGGETVVFQVGAFASGDKAKAVVEQLKAAKLPHFTESVATSSGVVTRVRIGPFASKAAADRALGRAKALGLNPVNVAPK